jgi:hypothetical protein
MQDINVQEAINHFKHGISHDIFKEPVTTYAKLAVEALEGSHVRCGECIHRFIASECPMSMIEKHELIFLMQRDDDYCSHGEKEEAP